MDDSVQNVDEADSAEPVQESGSVTGDQSGAELGMEPQPGAAEAVIGALPSSMLSFFIFM